MSAASAARARSGWLVLGEIAKIPAFLRRDLLTALSYRVYFVSDVLGLLSQALLFYFISKMVDTGELPAYGDTPTTYLEFVVVGVAVGVFVQFALTRVAAALRQEQLQGTLESMLATPTAPGTIQLGSVVFDLVYVPVRTIVFLAAMTVAFGLDFEASGVAPAALVLLAFLPFVWGLGVLGAAVILVARRGGGVATLVGGLLALFSGAYFPLSLLPSWLEQAAAWNPIAITLEGMRSSLLAGADWGATSADLATLVPLSLLALVIGMSGFRLALRYERARGTLGVY
jgi:ABC-2 type transport system permease protein